MKALHSLTTIEKGNIELFDKMMSEVYPELYFVKIALEETGVNPLILPKIIRSLSNLALGTGFGKVQVFMQKTVITQIKGEESINVNERAVIENEY